MKKTLIALAAVAAATAASAQVTLSGTFNADLQNKMSASDTTIGAGDAILSAAFSEDLGGGNSLKGKISINAKTGRGKAVAGQDYSLAMTTAAGTFTLKNYLAGYALLNAGVSAEDDMNDMMGGYLLRTRVAYDAPEVVKGLTFSLSADRNVDAAYTSAEGLADGTASSAELNNEFQLARPVDNFNSSNIGVSFDYAFGAAHVGYWMPADGDKSEIYVGYNFGAANVEFAYGDYGASGTQTELTVVAPLTSAITAGLHIAKAEASSDKTAYGVQATYALSKRTKVIGSLVKQTQGSFGSTAEGENYRVRLSHSF